MSIDTGGLGAEVEHATHGASETGNMGARLPRAERRGDV